MRFSYILVIAGAIGIISIASIFAKPVNISPEKRVEIPYGTSVHKSGEILKEAGIIKSKEAYIILSKILHPDGIVAGRYSFSGNITVFSALHRIAGGDFGRDQIKLTIPEGFTIDKTLARIYNLFPNIDKAKIKNNLSGKEGYIFPETYFFDKDVTAEELLSYLNQKSESRLNKILDPLTTESPETKRILTIASLIESEGRTKDERKMIAGIIENRLRIGMALQLDATVQYITGRGSSDLTLKDLKIDSPYNTYVYRGLPPTPISSPGEESIYAALHETKNDYLFYLHDNSGQIHYAKTFEEHVRNKNKYLK